VNRDPDINVKVQKEISKLIALYQATDPTQGKMSEEIKLERARFAMHIWWKLFSTLMSWAQEHILADVLCSQQEGFQGLLAEETGRSLNKNSHDLEKIGFHLIDRNISDFLSSNENSYSLIPTPILRSFIAELLTSADLNTAFWREPLKSGLKALNIGETVDIFAQDVKGKQGQPYSLRLWKYKAIQHVYLLHGSDRKKHQALMAVGEAIGQNIETLRTWEKKFKKDRDFSFGLNCAFVAGQLGKSIAKSPNDYERKFGINRGVSPVDMAEFIKNDLIKNDLSMSNVSAYGTEFGLG